MSMQVQGPYVRKLKQDETRQVVVVRANQVSSSEDPILVGRRCGETALGRGEVCVH